MKVEKWMLGSGSGEMEVDKWKWRSGSGEMEVEKWKLGSGSEETEDLSVSEAGPHCQRRTVQSCSTSGQTGTLYII